VTFHKALFLLLISTLVAAQSHFTSVESTGVPYIIIITNVDVAGTDLVVDAEIGVFNDSLCVGVGTFTGSYNYQFSAWQANQSQELPGFTVGNEMQFRVWTLYDGSWQEFEASPVFEAGDGTFGSGVYAVLSMNVSVVDLGSGTPAIQPESFRLGAYPNPFNARITLPVTLAEQSSAKLSIVSLQGQEIWSRSINQTTHLSWNGLDSWDREVPSGIYMVVLRSDSKQLVESITLLK
jgi:hypothetical protein